ncbi:hypothetical protein ABY58_00675 [Edwardsiella ictaluri]|nr:hypothetical protein ABY58_00675 [Edwardsiella ictaluri]
MGYHRRSIAGTAMFRSKTWLGGYPNLRDQDAQVGEAMTMVNTLNRMAVNRIAWPVIRDPVHDSV